MWHSEAKSQQITSMAGRWGQTGIGRGNEVGKLSRRITGDRTETWVDAVLSTDRLLA